MHVFGVGTHLFLREAMKDGGDHRKVLVKVTISRCLGEGRQERRVTVHRYEGLERREPIGPYSPQRLTPDSSAGEVAESHRQKGGDQLRFFIAVSGVGETRARRCESARRVREVVGESLIGVDPAARA